jgi:hypothetical protein
MLIKAGELAATMQRKCTRRHQCRCSSTKFDNLGWPQSGDFPNDMAQEAHIRLPASQMRKGVVRQCEFIEKGALVRLSPAGKACQQPGPADRAKAQAPGQVGEAAPRLFALLFGQG